MYLVTSAQMRAIEAAADARGNSYADMMQRAGRAVAAATERLIADEVDRSSAALDHNVQHALPQGIQHALQHGVQIVVLVGPGNNGGDGLVAAEALAVAGHSAQVILWQREPSEAMARALGERQVGVPILQVGVASGLAILAAWLDQADVVIDALLGTGANRPVEGMLAAILDTVKAACAGRGNKRPKIVAVDLPTGLNADSGAIDPHAVPADLTVTFGCPKVGHFTLPGASFVGRLEVDTIGIDPTPAELNTAAEIAPLPTVTTTSEIASRPDLTTTEAPIVPIPTVAKVATVATAAEIAATLPARPLGAHKGTFGRALIVAGSVNYVGAAYLAASAAYRAGCGLVTVAVVKSIQAIIATLVPEATFEILPEEAGVVSAAAVKQVVDLWDHVDAVLIGPGLTSRPPADAFMDELLTALDRRSTAIASPPNAPPQLVVDADGLNLVARFPDGLARLPAGSVLTPHLGEMARLSGLAGDELNADRLGTARRFAGAWGHVVVLKGAYTVVAAPDGHTSVNPFANPALATAGTGDVLAGIITGLMAQGMAPFEAARAGAFVHAQAGELAAAPTGGRGVMARDVLGAVGRAMAEIAAGLRAPGDE